MIYLGADHRGYDLKEKIKRWLRSKGWEHLDLGNEKLDSEDDYPDFAVKVARKIKKGDFGLLFCGSGVGMDVVANRFRTVRCGLGFTPQQIRIAKRDDNINCLSLASDYTTEEEARPMVEMLVETNFSGTEKYLRRLTKIDKIK